MTEGTWPDQPHYKAKAMKCSHCGAVAQQTWQAMQVVHGSLTWTPYILATCRACGGESLWHDTSEVMLYPTGLGGPVAPADLPEVVRPLYDEARSITSLSARSACALLRLALEALLEHLYPENKGNLNEMIGQARVAGLEERVVRAMDVLRSNGNSSIHDIRREDTPEMAASLFRLLNLVVRQLITEPQEVDAMYDALPAGVLQAIERRDAPKNA